MRKLLLIGDSKDMVKIEHELRGKRVLVTGTAGFIGSRLVKALLN